MDQITPAKKFLKSLKLRESITLFRGLESKPHSGKEECAHSHTYTLQSHTYSSHGIAAYIKITSDCRRYSTTIFHYRIFSFIFNKTHFLSGTGDGLGVKKTVKMKDQNIEDTSKMERKILKWLKEN